MAVKGEAYMRKIHLGLDQVKEQISLLKGREVEMNINRGRKKIDTISGVIKDVYPSVFTLDYINLMSVRNFPDGQSDFFFGGKIVVFVDLDVKIVFFLRILPERKVIIHFFMRPLLGNRKRIMNLVGH